MSGKRSQTGDRVVILGGSVTGMFAAGALAESYREVIVVDRDQIVGVREARRGAPQARHINGLLVQGARNMEELFPDITAEMIAAGCPMTDLSGTVRWYFGDKPLRQIRAGLTNVGSTRPVLEYHLRERVKALGNVTFMEGYDITGLATTPDRSRVTGARVQSRDDGGEEVVVEADLVIDATGRGSRTPVWLEALGYPRVEEEGTKVGVGYATRQYRMRSDPFGSDHSIICVANPALPRGAIFTKTDGGKVELTTYGILGDHPPTDPEGFTLFVKSLVAPEIYESIVEAEPLTDPVLFRFPTTLRRRYERMARLPEGLLVMGDAVCTPSPVFAQAQSLAAIEALALRDQVRSGVPPQPREFMAQVGRIIDPAWEMTEAMNLVHPRMEGRRTRKVRFLHWYMKRVQQAALTDPKVTEALMRSAGLVDQDALLRPGVIWRVLRSRP